MILDEINKEIETEYENRQKKAKQLLEEREHELYERFPEIKAIDRTINGLGILIGYRAMKRRPPSHITRDIPESYIELDSAELNFEIDKLKKEKKNILCMAQYPENYAENAYICKTCSDTGFILNKNNIYERCECSKKMFAMKLKKVSGVLKEDTFDKFSDRFYSDDVNPQKYGIKISPKAHMQAVYNRCLRFARQFKTQEVKNMIFMGNSGLGKTFLGNCIINELTDNGISCLYMSATSLFKPFAPGFASPEKASDIINFIMNCDFLMIDDLGSEKYSDTRYAELIEILNTREIRSRSEICRTVITTNLTPANLFACYGERVTSRLLGEYDIVRFVGDDIRLKYKA